MIRKLRKGWFGRAINEAEKDSSTLGRLVAAEEWYKKQGVICPREMRDKKFLVQKLQNGQTQIRIVEGK